MQCPQQGGSVTRKEHAMQWITRERAKVDRIACPWLISRFIDPTPEFLYVPAAEVMSEAAERFLGKLRAR